MFLESLCWKYEYSRGRWIILHPWINTISHVVEALYNPRSTSVSLLSPDHTNSEAERTRSTLMFQTENLEFMELICQVKEHPSTINNRAKVKLILRPGPFSTFLSAVVRSDHRSENWPSICYWVPTPRQSSL